MNNYIKYNIRYFINEEEAKKQGMTLNNGKVDNIKLKEKEESVQPKIKNKINKHSLENEDKVVQLSLNKVFFFFFFLIFNI